MSSDARELVSVAQHLRQQGRFADARGAAERALEIEPDNASAWFNLGAALGGLGELEAAEAAYRRALERNPRYPEAWSNLGGLLGAKGATEEQLAAYQKAIDANPQLAPVWSNLGNALCNARRHAEAESASRRAVELDPRFVPGWLNLGRALREMKRPAEARAACQRAVELAPDSADAWAGLGNALMGLREFAAAIEGYRKATSLRPQSSDFHTNLGIALRRIGLDVDGDASLRRALGLDPSNDFASWNLAESLLERGELAEGWARYEARWARPDSPPRRFSNQGGPPFNGRALLWGEQGVGDHLLYARMAAEVAQAGAAVTLETDARLVALLRRSFPGLEVVAQTDPPQVDSAEFDHVLPLGALGGLLRPSFDAFPRNRGYLVADAPRSRRYREALVQMLPRNSLIVGIAWRSSNPELANEKSAPLKEWGQLLTLPGISFVSLQYGKVAEERRGAERSFGITIATLPELDVFADLDGLAALQAACDLVITTSTVNAHLTGALGLPGWVLLPKRIGTLWYWFKDRNDSPWYPSLELIRQSHDGDWTGAIEVAAQRLRARVKRAS
jgi:tetratricopeptide (TPR) repeat protein